MKPNWDDAPKRAQYCAMDGDGTWCWYAEEPVWDNFMDHWTTDGWWSPAVMQDVFDGASPMTNLKQRAQKLLTAYDEANYPSPEEVQQFLRDVVALEPAGYIMPAWLDTARTSSMPWEAMWRYPIDDFRMPVYTLGAPNDRRVKPPSTSRTTTMTDALTRALLNGQKAQNETPAEVLATELRALYRHHVNTLESARDQIISRGGECDPLDVMEARDPVLKRVRDVLESTRLSRSLAAGKVAGEMDRTAPPKVWLQVNIDGDAEDRSEAIPQTSWMDLAWHYESLGGQEVEYIRADLAYTAPPADPAKASGSAPLLSADEMQALRRFAETTEDDESYDVPKEMMKRLAAGGAVAREGRPGWYFVTEYGKWLLDAALATAPESREAGLRDAYEGAREDLLDWKGRAQRAEAELRRLGYAGIDASEKPEARQREGVEALAREAVDVYTDAVGDGWQQPTVQGMRAVVSLIASRLAISTPPRDPAMTTTHDVPMPEPVVEIYERDDVGAIVEWKNDSASLTGKSHLLYTADQVRDTAIKYADARCAEVLAEAIEWRDMEAATRAERDELAEKVKAMEDNDRRYRWLRDAAKTTDFTCPRWVVSVESGGMGQTFRGDDLDAAIDAAGDQP